MRSRAASWRPFVCEGGGVWSDRVGAFAKAAAAGHVQVRLRMSRRRATLVVMLLGCLFVLVAQWRLVRMSPGLDAAFHSLSRSSAPSLSIQDTCSDEISISSLLGGHVAGGNNESKSNLHHTIGIQPPTDDDTTVTVVLEYSGTKALCRQLHALIQQLSPPDAIWVSALRDPDRDGGRAARRIVDSFEASSAICPISVISSVGTASMSKVWGQSANSSDAADVRLFGRLARFHLALQVCVLHPVLAAALL